jgi:phosphoesterase RecJ-like protein
MKVALMFKEMGTFIKVSLRSVASIDVGIIATALGGGGHDHSAATMIEGKLDDVIKTTVAKIHSMLIELDV